MPLAPRSFCRAAHALAVAAALAAPATGGDWPQILGPARDGQARQERLADRWPESGPPLLWQREVGAGLAGVAVAQGRLVLFHRRGGQSLVEALDPHGGRGLWKQSFPARYNGGFHGDNGPRCVPLIHRDHVYLCSAEGDLHCLALADGQVRWSRRLYEELQGQEGYFGAGSSPIVEGDKLLLNAGGQDGAGLVALALNDGRTLWKATDEAASYSSPIAVTQGGARHVIFVTRLHVVSVDPESGQVRFRFPFGKTGPTVNAATPLVAGGRLFVTASYGIGARLVDLSGPRPTTVWESDEVLSSQFSTSVLSGGALYGIDGRQDQGLGRLRCVDWLTGQVRWSVDDFGMGHLLLADGKLLVTKTDGSLVLARVNPQRFELLARTAPGPALQQALPALADGRLYVRDEQALRCLDLRPEVSP
jgi:outer membrane protein assembly factor BamB